MVERMRAADPSCALPGQTTRAIRVGGVSLSFDEVLSRARRIRARERSTIGVDSAYIDASRLFETQLAVGRMFGLGDRWLRGISVLADFVIHDRNLDARSFLRSALNWHDLVVESARLVAAGERGFEPIFGELFARGRSISLGAAVYDLSAMMPRGRLEKILSTSAAGLSLLASQMPASCEGRVAPQDESDVSDADEISGDGLDLNGAVAAQPPVAPVVLGRA